jgi:HPt (histidine-containing phosphotransfer) domain-containing protein
MNQQEHLPPGRQCCNLDFLEVSLGRNRKTALRLVGLFVDGYPALLQRLEDGLVERDLASLGRVLHDIRGNCVLFSAQECLAQTIRMEGFMRKVPVSSGDGADGVDWTVEGAVLRDALERLHGELCAYLAAASP